jgi:hypothetical protein
MTAIGRQGKVLSRDMDLMIMDDLEDHDSTALPSARSKTRSWWSTLISSRKEVHTGVIVVGSRQHADDLYGWILGGGAALVGGWHTIVNAAHDPDCDIDERAYYEHTACMLCPEIRSYKWLIEKRKENRYMGTSENFDMVPHHSTTAQRHPRRHRSRYQPRTHRTPQQPGTDHRAIRSRIPHRHSNTRPRPPPMRTNRSPPTPPTNTRSSTSMITSFVTVMGTEPISSPQTKNGVEPMRLMTRYRRIRVISNDAMANAEPR